MEGLNLVAGKRPDLLRLMIHVPRHQRWSWRRVWPAGSNVVTLSRVVPIRTTPIAAGSMHYASRRSLEAMSQVFKSITRMNQSKWRKTQQCHLLVEALKADKKALHGQVLLRS